MSTHCSLCAIVTKIIRHPTYMQTHSVYLKGKYGGGFAVNGWVDPADVQKEEKTAFPYMVHMIGGGLNIRYGPGTDYPVARVVCGRESFTIVEEALESVRLNGEEWETAKAGFRWIDRKSVV